MAIRGIDLTTLTLKAALDLATLIEEEARDRYEELADQMQVHHTPDVERFFRRMVEVEQRHRDELARRRQALFGAAPPAVSRAAIFDVEAPDYDEVRQGMSVRAALESAMRSEVKAHDFFVRALPRVTDPDVKTLFEELRDEEVEHRQWVQAELDRLPATGGPDGDVSDEPVAQ